MCCLQNSFAHAREAAFLSPQAAQEAKLHSLVRFHGFPRHFSRARPYCLSRGCDLHVHVSLSRRRAKCFRASAFSEQESAKESLDQARGVGVDDVDLSSRTLVDGSFPQGDGLVSGIMPGSFGIEEDGPSTSGNVLSTQAQESDKQHALGQDDATVLEAEEVSKPKLGNDLSSKPPKIFSHLGPLCAPAWEVMKGNPFTEWINNWSVWQEKRRLEHLLRQADTNPKDVSKQSALLAELNKHSPEAVIKRFEQREHSTDAQCVVEYLRALLMTNAISEYLPDERSGKSATLPVLLQELKHRAGGLDEPFATPGMTDKHPLHVVMVDAKGSKSMRFVQELISTCLFMIFFSVMWVMFAAFLRKYVSSMGGMGPSTGISTSTAYAPKEYSKETLPEKVPHDLIF